MRPSARLAAAAEILDGFASKRPVEPQLKAWARDNRYAGSKDRRAIADRVYTILRHLLTCAAQGGSTTGRALVLGSLVAVDELTILEIDALCPGGYGLAPLDEAERAALTSPPNHPSEAARLDWPAWLWDHANDAFGTDTPAELDALRQRAPVDLRVNTLKTTVEQAISTLQADDFAPETVGPLALRLPPNSPVFRAEAYTNGLIELQDAGSQIVAAMTGTQPGETVLDFCAGAGGKTLALAAMMQNDGILIAHDIDPARMAALPARATRAGVTCLRPIADGALPDDCDRVLVDAPCSGSGSWRRDPAGKWALSPERLAELTAAQDDALNMAAQHIRPGGTLTYATCSILPVENEARITAFLACHTDFHLLDQRRLHPARDGCDGFFAATLSRAD